MKKEGDCFEVTFKVFQIPKGSQVNGYSCEIKGFEVVDGKKTEKTPLPWLLPVDRKLALEHLIDAGRANLTNFFKSVFPVTK